MSSFKPAYSEWWDDAIMVRCMPELDYFIVEVLRIDAMHQLFDHGIPENMFEKYGVILDDSITKYDCKLNYDKSVRIEIIHHFDPFSTPPYSCHGSNYEHHSIKLWTYYNDPDAKQEPELLFDDVVSWYCNDLDKKMIRRLKYHSGEFSGI